MKNELEFKVQPQLLGINQRQNPQDIPDAYSPLMKNQSLTKPGTWAKRKGSDMLYSTRTGSIAGLIEYNAATATSTARIRVWRGSNNDLQVYNTGTEDYSNIDTTVSSIDLVSSVNFLNRVYHVSNNNRLAYETGGTLTNVTNQINADCMAVSSNFLVLGNITTLTGSVHYEDQIIYSWYDGANNTPTDTFTNPSDSSLANSTRRLRMGSPVKGIIEYSGNGLFYIFTAEKMFSFDMRNTNNATGTPPAGDQGLINKNAVTICNGLLIFMNPEGRIFVSNGQGATPASWELEDDSNGEAIINSINKSSTNVRKIAAGSLGSEFYFSVGDVSYRGETITNAVIKGLISQNGQVILYDIDSYPVQFQYFTNATLSNQKVLLAGSSSTEDVWQLNTGTNDNGTAIDAYGRTKFFDFGLPFEVKDWNRVFIKYRPQSVADTYLRVKYALNGSSTYTTLTDPDNSIGTSIQLDMNNGYSSSHYEAVAWIPLPREALSNSISIEVGNGQTSESYEIINIGLEFSLKGKDYRVTL